MSSKDCWFCLQRNYGECMAPVECGVFHASSEELRERKKKIVQEISKTRHQAWTKKIKGEKDELDQ